MWETWLIHMRDMTHSCERHDSFMWETWLIHMRDMTHSYQRHDSYIWETWLIHMRDMTHSYERHDSFIWETWLIHMRDMTHSYDNTWVTRFREFTQVSHSCLSQCRSRDRDRIGYLTAESDSDLSRLCPLSTSLRGKKAFVITTSDFGAGEKNWCIFNYKE